MSAGPATDFVRALDAPFPLLRDRFSEWAPTMAVGAFAPVLVSLPNLFLMSSAQNALTTGDLDAAWPALAATYGSICVLYPILFAAVGAQAACMADLLAGRPTSVVGSFAALGSGGYLGPLLVACLASGLAMLTCCVGGFLLWLPLGLLLPAAAAGRNGLESLSRGLELALLRTGPGLFDRPGWKVCALACSWFVLQTGAGMIAQLPTFLSMGAEIWEKIQAGDIDALRSLGVVDPWIGSFAAVIGGVVQMFTNGYLYAGMALIYKDAVEQIEGTSLERQIRGGAPEP